MPESCCTMERCSDLRLLEVACSECGLDPMCQVLTYAESDSGVPPGILLRRQAIGKGEILFNVGQLFSVIYAVKAGSFKAVLPDPTQQDRVVGFYLPGDLIGVEGMANRHYTYTVRALEAGYVCVLDVGRLPECGRSTEDVQQALIDLLGAEVALSHSQAASLIRQNADQRLAAFILSLAKRSTLRGLSGSRLNLGMSRTDMGSYLGLARETVSRVLTKFQKAGLIQLKNQNLLLLDQEELEHIAASN